MQSGNEQKSLGNAKELAAAETLLDPSGVIKELHQVAFLAAESCNIAQALHAYEQAYNIAHQSKYVGAEHVVTCAFLVWYRGIDGNVDGARQAMDEAQSIVKTDIDKRTLAVVIRMMAKKQPLFHAQLQALKL